MLRVSYENVAFDTCGLTCSGVQAKGEKFKAAKVTLLANEKAKDTRQWLEGRIEIGNWV